MRAVHEGIAQVFPVRIRWVVPVLHVLVHKGIIIKGTHVDARHQTHLGPAIAIDPTIVSRGGTMHSVPTQKSAVLWFILVANIEEYEIGGEICVVGTKIDLWFSTVHLVGREDEVPQVFVLRVAVHVRERSVRYGNVRGVKARES